MPKKPNPQQDHRREINKMKYAKGWVTRRRNRAESERVKEALKKTTKLLAAKRDRWNGEAGLWERWDREAKIWRLVGQSASLQEPPQPANPAPQPTNPADEAKRNAMNEWLLKQVSHAQTKARVSPTRPSESDGLLEMANIVRDDMLCSFVANMAYGRRVVDVPRYVPVMLTRMHAEAIEEFLREHGYSEFGKAGISPTKD